jgi:predicted Zn-dependent protease with MMP-like domain
MSHTISGKIIHIFDEKRISEKLTVRDIVVKTQDEYPQEIVMQLANQKCDLVIGHYPGENVTAHVNLKGRQAKDGTKRWFNIIEAWKLEF